MSGIIIAHEQSESKHSRIEVNKYSELDLAVARVLVRAGMRAVDTVDTHHLVAPGQEHLAVQREAEKLIDANRSGKRPDIVDTSGRVST